MNVPAAAQVTSGIVHRDEAWPRALAQNQEPTRCQPEATHGWEAQGPWPPAQEGQDHKDRDDASIECTNFCFSPVINIVDISADEDSLMPFCSIMLFAYMIFCMH